MKTIRTFLQVFCIVALVSGISVSISMAAPESRAVAAKKAAQNRAKISASKNADKFRLNQQQENKLEEGQAAVKAVQAEREASKQVASGGATPASVNGKKMFKACSVCHGSNGTKTAPGQLEGRNILSRSYDELVRELIGYREGISNNGGLEVIMIANMEGWSDEDIKEVASYIVELADKNKAKNEPKESANKDSKESATKDKPKQATKSETTRQSSKGSQRQPTRRPQQR